MANQISGLDGYLFYRRNPDNTDTQLNSVPIPEGGDWADFRVTGLDASTDYTGQFFAAPVDKAGNVGAKVPFTLGAQTLDPTPEQNPMSAADEAAIDAIMAQCRARASGPGVTIAIVSPRGYLFKSYGNGTTAPDRHYRIASQTKMWTAHAVLQAIDDDRLAFTDTLEQFVPGVPNGTIITIEHLLTMTSGVYDYQLDSGLGFSFYINPAMALSVDDIIGRIKAGAPMFPPGGGYHYTNSNYFLLGRVLEAVDSHGRRCDQIIAQDVLAAAGMVNSSFPTATGGLPAPAASLWHNNVILSAIGLAWPQNVTVQNPAMVWASGAGVSLISDMIQWGRTIREGTLLSPAMHDKLLSTFHEHPMAPWGLHGQSPDHYGYGYGLYRVGSWLGHGGSWIGADSGTMVEPTTGTVISVFTNYQVPTAPSMTLYWFELAEYLLPNSAKYPGYGTGDPVEGGAFSTMIPGMVSTAAEGRVYAPGEFQPLTELYTSGELDAVVDKPTPVGATGVWVKGVGAGAGGRPGGPLNSAGGTGGGGGGGFGEFYIPSSALGPTYSASYGLAGGPGLDGGDTVFASGAITMRAGGGRVAGTGGVCTMSGVVGVSTYTGGAAGADSSGVAGAGGGRGGSAPGFAVVAGTPGGASATRAGGEAPQGAPGGSPVDAEPLNGGAGGAGGNGNANGGLGGNGALGGDGGNRIEWKAAPP
ncbi:minor tail protein [Mycobacterium phage Weirdo19]|uniref:Minor tail protein n=1 Tax=Mycobacterium phage Weirdo19 TaxID=2601610 RepID=A0A6M2YSV4_9CAUD|nr:minor tail protein with lysin activity [Mycobacterium phage Weirdo19]QEA10790.1 minor tail protein [Mycobacterium phage Weirdo19]